jgi:hypothetical protein
MRETSPPKSILTKLDYWSARAKDECESAVDRLNKEVLLYFKDDVLKRLDSAVDKLNTKAARALMT